MPFIPHTEREIREMLDAIGVASIDQLFDEIPAGLMAPVPAVLPDALSEMEVTRLMTERAERDGAYLNFLGAGAYEHHVPAAVWQLATRGEFYSAYTPYQAEASQGTLQVLYEYQSMICALTGLDVTNASLYDGASALAEAVLMAVRAHKSSRRVLMPATVHPVWRRVVHTIVRNQGIELVPVPYCLERGHVLPELLAGPAFEGAAALMVPQPNFFGVLEPVDELTDWAHERGVRVIAAVNPTALAVLKPPGAWGKHGADIAVGDGQPLGVPLASGGPYFGFMSCTKELIRQMPGRLVGATVDGDGRRGFVLTLQAREQHIRRSKATSNICTNQGLMATAATMYMALIGPEGLANVARACHANTVELVRALTAIDGVERAFSGPVFHEAVLRLKTPLAPVLNALKAQGILGGFDLVRDYPELGPALLVCATETKRAADIERYAANMARIIGEHFRPARGALRPEPKTNLKRKEHGMASVTLGGNPITVAGNFPKKGDTASEFSLTPKDLKDVGLKDFAGKRKVLNIVPSLDTPTCAKSTRVFNEKASGMNNTVVLVISADLPFAMSRFCTTEGLENVVTLSTMRGRDFHAKYGVDITDGPLKGLTARAVVVLDEANKVLHAELVPEIKQEPNYDAALAALK